LCRYNWSWGFYFIISLVVFGNIQTAKAEDRPTVEGEWELISASAAVSQKYIGQRVSISRKSDGYEVKWLDGSSTETYSGNETRITHTFLEDLGQRSPDATGESYLPPSVSQQVAGRKVPINVSYTLSGDGRFLQKAGDYVQVYWSQRTGLFHHYEIEPGLPYNDF